MLIIDEIVGTNYKSSQGKVEREGHEICGEEAPLN